MLGSSRVLGARALPPARLRRRARRRRDAHDRGDARRARRRGARLARLARGRRRPPLRAAPLQAPAPAAHRRARRARLRRRSTPPAASSRASPTRASRPRCVRSNPTLPFAVIGLGRLGGAELSYASDIDVIFVYDGTTAADFATAERTATRLVRRDRRQHVGGPHVPRRHAAAPRRQPGPARAIARRVPHVLRAVGADVGVPGAHQGALRRRRRRRSASASSRSRTSTCTAIRSPRSGDARSGA